MTRSPLARSLSLASTHNGAGFAAPEGQASPTVGARPVSSRVPMPANLAYGSERINRPDNQLASRWQAPKPIIGRGPALVDAQQTLFAALKTAAQRRAG
jgi:hypothetical protein